MHSCLGAVYFILLLTSATNAHASAGHSLFLFVGLYDGFLAADWAMRWIGSDATFAERLVAFAAVEVSALL